MPKIIEPILTPQDAAWGRQVNLRQLELEQGHDRSLKEQAATNKSTAAALDTLTRQLNQIIAVQNAVPVPAASTITVSPISASSTSFTQVATTTISVPPGKTFANLALLGSVALLDTVTGGVAAPPDARFSISGTPYPRANGIPGTKDAGASTVNNVVVVGASAAVDVTGLMSVTVDLEVRVFHATAYATSSPSNFASLSVQGMFS